MSNSNPEQVKEAAMADVHDDDGFYTSLKNLSAVKTRMDDLQRFLVDSINRNVLLPADQMRHVDSEIASAIRQIVRHGSSLLLATSTITSDTAQPLSAPQPPPVLKIEDPKVEDLAADEPEEIDGDHDDGICEILEPDAVELLAEHVHFCQICGKGFKRDANLRMHMRAHGNQFKTPASLAKPESEKQPISSSSQTTLTSIRFSCPYTGCNRNKRSSKFRSLKSIICLRNHFKRSHCPKTFACDRCGKKSFAVAADLKSHLKVCGEAKWRCSCGTSFSRKDKLFGHMALFEGHMPAVVEEIVPPPSAPVAKEEGGNDVHSGLFDLDGLFDGIGSDEGHEMFGSSSIGSFWNQNDDGVNQLYDFREHFSGL